MSFPVGLSATPGSAPALGGDKLVLECRASAIGAVLALVEQAVVAELRRVRALGRLRGIRFVFQLDGGRIRLLDQVRSRGVSTQQRVGKRRGDQPGRGELDEPPSFWVHRGFSHGDSLQGNGSSAHVTRRSYESVRGRQSLAIFNQ